MSGKCFKVPLSRGCFQFFRLVKQFMIKFQFSKKTRVRFENKEEEWRKNFCNLAEELLKTMKNRITRRLPAPSPFPRFQYPRALFRLFLPSSDFLSCCIMEPFCLLLAAALSYSPSRSDTKMTGRGRGREVDDGKYAWTDRGRREGENGGENGDREMFCSPIITKKDVRNLSRPNKTFKTSIFLFVSSFCSLIFNDSRGG